MKHPIAFLTFMLTVTLATAQPVRSSGNQDFCQPLERIIADYPNRFENLKGVKITGEKAHEFFYLSKVNPEGVVMGRIIEDFYQGYFTWETEDFVLAVDTFEGVKQMLESCKLPFRLEKVRDEEDSLSHAIVYQPVDAPAAFANMEIMIHYEDFWFIGIDVSLSIMEAK